MATNSQNELFKMSILEVYAPTLENIEEKINWFYITLENLKPKVFIDMKTLNTKKEGNIIG